MLVIADEVITGFGRLGTFFGSDAYGIEPDIMVLSKQITSSYIPLAAVLVSPKVHETIAENSGRVGTLGHWLHGQWPSGRHGGGAGEPEHH